MLAPTSVGRSADPAPWPVSDLVRLHRRVGIELRLVDRLRPWWDVVVPTSVGRSGTRLADASP